jgi:small subunit ribosomal protein S2
LLIDREIEKLQKNIGGIVNLKGTPGALFVVDARRERTAIREAKIAGVKVVALVDTNSNPEGIDYVIPGNDDAIKSIAVILKAISDAVESGYQEFAKKSADDKAAAQKAAEKAAADKIIADKAAEEAKNSAIKVTVAEAPRVVPEEVEVLEEVLTEETKEEKAKKDKIVKEEAK